MYSEVYVMAQELERGGRKVTHLEVGQPDFAAPAHALEATIRSLQRGDTKYIANAGRSGCARSLVKRL